ncbi:glycosyltransferase [Candidatus Gracilibacteria bacterium]|nr:glycosyltransferase [Candidatus Gracilibacteria bacterium]
MRFSIITPTYRRAEKLMRAVDSLRNQTYTDWEIIIVNDSPTDESYNNFTSVIDDPRIHYHVNDKNLGVNYTRNRAIDLVSANSKWIILLDDDDYFAPDTLQTFYDLILMHGENKWFVTNRAYINGQPVTQFPKDDHEYSYAWQYLLLKRCKGDATHCIETKLITQNQIQFSKNVKQGEEWFFFYQIGLLQKMYYHSHNSTITDGYDTSSGLNFRKRTREERLNSLTRLAQEGSKMELLRHPTFLLYLLARYISLVFK